MSWYSICNDRILAQKNRDDICNQISVKTNIIFLISAVIVSYIERICLLKLGMYAKRDFYIGTVFTVFFFVLLAVRFPKFGQNGLIEFVGKNLSLGIYVVHLMVLRCVSKIYDILYVWVCV